MLLSSAPYAMTSDELLLAVENDRKGPVAADAFFARSQACLRVSPLVKRHGYGLHHDAEGRVALVAMEGAGLCEAARRPNDRETPGHAQRARLIFMPGLGRRPAKPAVACL